MPQKFNLYMRELCSFTILLLYCCWTAAEDSCSWSARGNPDDRPEIFWINMDKSMARRQSMEAHLNNVGLPHRRVKGLSFDEIYLPTDVVTGWETVHAKVHTSEKIPSNSNRAFVSLHGNVSHIVVGLVGRAKTNRIKEVGCTSSHLEAIRQAIYHNRTNSKYAIIIEDDIFIPFNIDFNNLV